MNHGKNGHAGNGTLPVARSVGPAKPSPELREAAMAMAKKLEAERWDSDGGGLVGIIAMDVTDALSAQNNPYMKAHDALGGNNRWIGGIFKAKGWKRSGETRSASNMERNTGSALRAVWYRQDRDLKEASKRNGARTPVASVKRRPSESEMRQAIESLRISVKFAEFQGHEGSHPEAVRRTMNWIAGQCNGDTWWT